MSHSYVNVYQRVIPIRIPIFSGASSPENPLVNVYIAVDFITMLNIG